jgi:hypothetical protein
MDVNAFQDTWLGTAITLQVALGFMCLTAFAIAQRALVPRRNRQR